MVLNPIIIWATGAPIGVNVLNGAVILALMSVPIIMSMGEDALKAVPDTYREAALALGASRWQVIYRVLVRGEEWPACRRPARNRASHRRDHGRPHGDGSQRPDSSQRV